MEGFTLWHALFWLIFLASFLIPMATIIKRTGHSPLWVLVSFIPMLNWIMLWVFAFKKWPLDKRDR